MGKTWNYSLRQRFQSPTFESVGQLEKLCPNESFTVENGMENLHKAGYISNLKSQRQIWDNLQGASSLGV